MPKKKKQPKKAKKETKKKKQPKEEELELDDEASSEESELEEEVEEAEEEIQDKQISKFIPSGKSVAPVLETIANVQGTPDIDWQLSPQRNEEKKEEKKLDYQLESQVSQPDYEISTPKQGVSAPIIKTKRIDVSTFGRQREQVGREFTMAPPVELQRDEEDYNLSFNLKSLDKEKLGRKEKIGKDYDPRAR